MRSALPQIHIDGEQLLALIAAMVVYQTYRINKTPPTEEQRSTLTVLVRLIPKLSVGGGLQAGEVVPLWLTVDDIRVMRTGLTTLLEFLQKLPHAPHLHWEIQEQIQELQALRTLLEVYTTTND